MNIAKTSLSVAALAVLGLAANRRLREILYAKAARLPVAENDITVERGLSFETTDGITLVSDLYRPTGVQSHPTIIIRTSYGRGHSSSVRYPAFFARRGYVVLIQDVRGCGDSGGVFVPLVDERRDGAATVAWVKRQPWCDGRIAAFGVSYLGYTSTAIGVDNDPAVNAVFSAAAPSGFRRILYGTGGFDLDTSLRWAKFVKQLQDAGYQVRISTMLREQILSQLGRARHAEPFDHLPIVDADAAATGSPIAQYQTFVRSADPDTPYWAASSITEEEISGIEAPVFLSSSWHDTALRDVLIDYEALASAGKAPLLSIGAGPHSNVSESLGYLRNAKSWFDHRLKGVPVDEAHPTVRFRVLGTREWWEADRWPVAVRSKRLYLQRGHALTEVPPIEDAATTSYRYDPMDPTPAVGGPLLLAMKPVKNNAQLEARGDTLVFTAQPFECATVVIGEIKATINVDTDVETVDLFVRINRVSRAGRSENVTDSIERLSLGSAAGGAVTVELSLVPTAIRFKRGERLRLLIASGAHPRVARNLGQGSTAEQAFMTEGRAATITVHHSRLRPSFIELPIAGPPANTRSYRAS
ncbi:MAG: CocE/NonD family hydrolase [Actinomycetota bacterium]